MWDWLRFCFTTLPFCLHMVWCRDIFTAKRRVEGHLQDTLEDEIKADGAMERVIVPPSSRLTPRLFTWVCVLLLALVRSVCEVTQAASGACPSDVTMTAHACFTEFSGEYQNMKNSPKLLCCGVDVETLRAFCSSYTRAARCIEQLLAQCGDPTAIEHALTNLKGARTALDAMCFDDTLIERYARHQSCITQAGPTTQQCMQRHLNASDNIRLLANVPGAESMEFCRAMRDTQECVQRNVRRQCGVEASDLAAILVRPMIRYSTTCDLSYPYTHPTMPDTPTWDHPDTLQTSQPSQDGSRPGSHHVYDVSTVSGSPRPRDILVQLRWTFITVMAAALMDKLLL